MIEGGAVRGELVGVEGCEVERLFLRMGCVVHHDGGVHFEDCGIDRDGDEGAEDAGGFGADVRVRIVEVDEDEAAAA